MDRLIRIFVRDRHGHPLPLAEVKFYLNGALIGTADNIEGTAALQLREPGTVKVEVNYPDRTTQVETLADGQDSFTFNFDVNGGYLSMMRDIIAAIVGALVVVGLILFAFYMGVLAGVLPLALGVVLAIAALSLAFVFKKPTVLQAQLIRSTFALAAGALATQIPGALNVNLSLGAQATITASGALAVYIVTFFWVPAGRDEPPPPAG